MDFSENYIKKILPKRPENSHKGIFGHVLNIAGSDNYRGAAYFSSLAPLKVGCGLSTLASTKNVINSVASLTPDVIFLPLKGDKHISNNATKVFKSIGEKYQAISIGCGISTEKKTVKFFEKLIEIFSELETPIVIDADGLNILSTIEPKKLPKNLILTPHPKELSRLLKVNTAAILSTPDFFAKKCCEKYNCTTVLKIHETIIVNNQGKFYINKTGNSALAHGGSGDVLCGMITGFLAQGVNIFDSSILAAYLHGKTAETASKVLSEHSTLASDLIKNLPLTMRNFA